MYSDKFNLYHQNRHEKAFIFSPESSKERLRTSYNTIAVISAKITGWVDDMEALHGIIDEIITGAARKTLLRYRNLLFGIVSLLIGLIEPTVFDVKLSPFGLAFACGLRLIGIDPLSAYIGALLACIMRTSLPTLLFLVFAAVPLFLPKVGKLRLKGKSTGILVSLMIPTLILGIGSFRKLLSSMLALCIIIMSSLLVALIYYLGKSLTDGSIALILPKQTSKKTAAAEPQVPSRTKIDALCSVVSALGESMADPFIKRQLRCVSDCIEKLGEPESKGGKKYDIAVGCSLTPKGANPVNGDSCLIRRKGQKVLLALSDGMGSGSEAETESAKVLDTIEKLLGIGYGLSEAAECANRIMLDKGLPDMFATLDIAFIDLGTGNVELLKNGASPGFLLRSSEESAKDRITYSTLAEVIEEAKKASGSNAEPNSSAPKVWYTPRKKRKPWSPNGRNTVSEGEKNGTSCPEWEQNQETSYGQEKDMYPSLLGRGSAVPEIRTLYSESLPIGIIEDICPAVCTLSLRRGDALVMMTDGICDALGEELTAVVAESLAAFSDPEEVANGILSLARKRSGADDMSVMVAVMV